MSPDRARTQRALGGALALALAVGAVAWIQAGGSGADGTGRAPAEQRIEPLGPQGRVAQFVVECAFSHAAPDDPIVHPGEPGASHLHQFFGATEVDAHSTADELRSSATTCQQQQDTASYWAPALYDDGALVEPTQLNAYYRPGPDVDPTIVRAFPPGLAMIAGDHMAEPPQPVSVVGWHCGGSPNLSSEPPTCSAGAPLALRVTFPDCWDGERADSDDHRSHMSISHDGRCPDSHPVPVVQLILDVRYPVHGPATLALASGPTTSAHADFLNAWDQPTLEREVAGCINRDLVCGVVSNRATG